MTAPPDGWQFAAPLAGVPPGQLCEVFIGRYLLLLVNTGDCVVAVQGLCPHQMARLCEGTVSDGWITCPRHLARFRLSDGACGPGWVLPPLRRYPTRIVDGDVLVPDPLVAMA